MKLAFFSTLCILLTSVSLYSQNSNIDDLFKDPDETITKEDGSSNSESSEEQKEADPLASLVNVFQAAAPSVTGSVSLETGFAAGFRNWEFKTTAANGSELEHFSAYYQLSSSINFSIRPTTDFRFFASLNAKLNEKNPIISVPSISNIYVDYTLANTIFFRLGVQGITWGQGLTTGPISSPNPGNFASPGRNAALKAFFPIGNNGLTLVIFPKGTNTNVLDLVYAGLFDFVLGPFSFGMSFKFDRNIKHSLVTDIYTKVAFLGIDLALEARLDFDLFPETNGSLLPQKDGALEPHLQMIGNFFWEESEILGIRLAGAYYFNYGPEGIVKVYQGTGDNTYRPGYGEHRISLGMQFTKIFPNGWNPRIGWQHHLNDESGQIGISIGGNIAPNLGLAFTVPIFYGPDFGLFRRNNPDPQKRVISLIISFTLSSNF